MEKPKFIEKSSVQNLPKKTGVYLFKDKRAILYIGKASNIKERVKNHLRGKGLKQNLFLEKIKEIGFISTNSEIEALLLEAELIKKYRPRYNVVWKDDKNYFYIAVTKEVFPRIFFTHQTKIKNGENFTKTEFIGPFVDGKALKKTLQILRKVFPYYTKKKHPKKFCQWCYLGLCPGPNPSRKRYEKDIKKLILVLRGKRKSVLKTLKKEMKKASLFKKFEEATKIRDRIFSLEKVISNAKIIETKRQRIEYQKIEKKLKKLLKKKKKFRRIEAYDVSNISGKLATGSMVTFINGKPMKYLYRKFKIRISGIPNDTAMIKEMLSRRFKHLEWRYPDLILIDGGRAQLNAALEIKNQCPKTKKSIFVASLAKNRNRLFAENKKEPILLKDLPREISYLILQLRDEAHRFAINYHRKLRRKELIG